jgi:hypothetical protein
MDVSKDRSAFIFVLLYSENDGARNIRDVSNYSPIFTAKHSRTSEFSATDL